MTMQIETNSHHIPNNFLLWTQPENGEMLPNSMKAKLLEKRLTRSSVARAGSSDSDSDDSKSPKNKEKQATTTTSHHPLSHNSSSHSNNHHSHHGSHHSSSSSHHGPHGHYHPVHLSHSGLSFARGDSNVLAEEEKSKPSQHERHEEDLHLFSDEDGSVHSRSLLDHPYLHHTSTKRKRNFTREEDEKIIEGVEKYGNEWESIVEWGHLDRTASQVRDRFRRIQHKKAESSQYGGKTLPKKQKVEEHPPMKLKRVDSHQNMCHSSHSEHSNDHYFDESDAMAINREIDRLAGWEKDLKKRDDEQKKKEDEMRRREDDLRRHEHEFLETRESSEHREQEYHRKVEAFLRDVLTKSAQLAANEARQTLLENNIRLGHLVYERHGSGIVEVWHPGAEFQQYERRLTEIAKLKEEIEQERKKLKKRFPKNLQETSDEFHELSEILSIRLLHLKKEETEIIENKDRLTIRNNLHIKETKRIADEDRSRFNNHPLLENRYLLLSLLGKGGFSEVYKAYDLKELREVACKIHSLNSLWSEQKKRNYSKHAVREYDIHKNLNHPRVVKLYDVFEIDDNSFCTVLEYCDGGDLDMYLKNHPILSEREAKSIISQIFQGLKYLNEQKRPIIHYDLKPGNILFHKGEVKITDFGLSKFYEEDSDGTELTSQGAGTYWYQPPECFETPEMHPKITCKVDVWAAGVIFYQMLYGKKPFGNGLSQQKFFTDHTLANEPTLEFPPKPVVSDLAKTFIRSCLIFQQKERPDVLTLVNDEYLKQRTKHHS
eukprot:TRINITY_DN2198_c0_g1_i1.p1 TRINITY_DN2198_c0_g1~~TRINITY_DN2198_c0_g1_i1.p1  ORF type:complete len:773 (-),score=121.37 TRINITY_DN2198_c0_g1_i1:107-2425(-)